MSELLPTIRNAQIGDRKVVARVHRPGIGRPMP
jgi:hypothetical protein